MRPAATLRLPAPYPPIERHGVVGDRRTAALVAADSTVDWLCLPAYDGAPLFGSLLDSERGGWWRLGQASGTLGRQRYRDSSAVLITTWSDDRGVLELTDAMAWPWDDRTAADGGADGRVLLRRLRCLRGEADCVLDLCPRPDFAPGTISPSAGGVVISLGDGGHVDLWASQPVAIEGERAVTRVRLAAGEELWAILSTGEETQTAWTGERAETELRRAVDYWHSWSDCLDVQGPRAEQIRRSALTVHLLSYAPTGSPVAAPTTSLPERIGADRNWDYRYAWVRDASLAVATLARLGETASGLRYMDCLTSYRSSTESPLQIVYGVDGSTDLPVRERNDLAGYRGSRPVRFGNRACGQRQLDSLGFFVECALTYLQQGGVWRDRFWITVRRAADYTARTWREPDSGIWELDVERHFISSMVMSWVVLDRAVKIAGATGHAAETDGWCDEMTRIHASVMDRGWSDRLGAFRQHTDADTLDASALLIPVMGFLPADHPRVRATTECIIERLTIDGFVHRYEAADSSSDDDEPLPVGEFEGAFLPCTFWLATALTLDGRIDEAEAIVQRVESLAGELGLFAEEVDARSGRFLGNTPLLFSQTEYVRAIQALDHERRQDVDTP